jgi:hypothetical protein
MSGHTEDASPKQAPDAIKLDNQRACFQNPSRSGHGVAQMGSRASFQFDDPATDERFFVICANARKRRETIRQRPSN